MLGLLMLVLIGVAAAATLPAWAAIAAVAIGASAPFLLVAARSWWTHKPVTWKSLGWAADQAPVSALGALVVAAVAAAASGTFLATATATKVGVGAAVGGVLIDSVRDKTLSQVDEALDTGTPIFKDSRPAPVLRSSLGSDPAPTPVEPGPSKTPGLLGAFGSVTGG